MQQENSGFGLTIAGIIAIFATDRQSYNSQSSRYGNLIVYTFSGRLASCAGCK
jgi:uncharacterized membrane protein